MSIGFASLASPEARPSAMTFTTARRNGVSSAVQLPGNANAAVPRTRVQRVVQAHLLGGGANWRGYLLMAEIFFCPTKMGGDGKNVV